MGGSEVTAGSARSLVRAFKVRRVLIGRPVVNALGTVLGWIAGDVFRIRRMEVREAMRLSGIQEYRARAAGMYRSLGIGLVELLMSALGIPLNWCASFEGDALDRLRARIEHRGFVVACAHTANWDLVACHVAEKLPLMVITKRLSIRWIDKFWQGIRRRRGVQLVSEGGAAKIAGLHLAKAGVVVAMLDQAPERRAGATRGVFLGRVAGLDLVPALLAMRARVPMVVAFPRRSEDGRYAIEIRCVIEPPRQPSVAWVRLATQTANDHLGHFVKEVPEQWLWLHRRWKPWPPRGTVRLRVDAREERKDSNKQRADR